MTDYVYVAMTDEFMSNWGRAKGLINKLVISCNSMDEALVVEENARNRSDMRYISICSTKPYYNPSRYFVSWHGREQGDYESWFIPGYFKKG